MRANKKSIEKNANIKAVVITDNAGSPLVKIKLDNRFDENLMGPFISAIRAFSNEILGEGREFQFHAGEQELYCLTKWFDGLELMIFALMEKKMEKVNIREEAEEALDVFVRVYGVDAIKSWNGNVGQFKQFEIALQNQIRDYYEKISPEDSVNGKKESIFIKILRKLRLN
ncbi:MAG: hypothetical protein ACTSUE_08215 [Promethearchaeota archaeon]